MTPNEGPPLVAQERSPTRQADSIVLVLSGPIDLADVPELCARVRVLLESCEAELVVCDVGALVRPDAVTVDALARLQLTARRIGHRVLLRGACGELLHLLGLMGLGDALPCGAASGLEPRGEAEEREQALGVEEEANPGDRAI